MKQPIQAKKDRDQSSYLLHHGLASKIKQREL
uniref:Uncharacterized protein n=2 Tax=Anguilla anguilla TaxID=7936 RepID=A0A0E9UJ35_ANGAN